MITADQRWKLYVLHQECMSAAPRNKAEALTKFREYLDTLTDPSSVAAKAAQTSNTIASLVAARKV